MMKPLMSEDEKQNADIYALSYDFACRIIRLYQYLTEQAPNREHIHSKQLNRCGTSIGANLHEAKHPQSDADFLSKAQIALKEAKESEYWLSLLRDNGYITPEQYSSLYNDLDRILRILIVITTRVRERLKREERERKEKINK